MVYADRGEHYTITHVRLRSQLCHAMQISHQLYHVHIALIIILSQQTLHE